MDLSSNGVPVRPPQENISLPSPLISVVIPAFNEEKLITAAIDSVRRCRFDRGVEIIVVDNASTDRTAETASVAGAKVVHEPHRQIARARNAGAGAASGTYLIFLDADSELHPDHLRRVAELLDSGKVIGGGAVISMDASLDYRLFVGFWNLLSVWARLAAGSFLFCERSVFEEIGGFDESLFAGEELALSKRLKLAGRQRGKRFVIFSDLPVRTSNRKTIDHCRWDVFQGLLKLAWRGQKGLRNRDDCAFWYPESRR